MARVPQANGGGVQRYSGPKIREEIGRPVLQNADTGSTLGDDVRKMGGAMIDAGARLKKEADDVAVLEQKNTLAKIENDLLYHPENGAFNKRGKNAFGTIEEVNTAYDKAYSDIEKSLVSEDQKKKLRQAYESSKLDINRQLSRHVGAQTQVYDTETVKAALEVEQNAVATNPLDTERRNASIIKQRIAIDQYAERQGMGPDQRKLLLEDAENKTNLKAIQTLVDTKDYMNAKSYFNDTKDSMTGEYRAKAERLVKESVNAGEAQAFTDNVMSKNMSMGQAFAEANKEQDPELRKAKITQIRDSFSQRKEAEAYNSEQLMKSIGNEIDRGTLWADIPQSRKDLMSPSQKNTMENYAKERAKGNDVEPGGKLFYDTMTIATNPATRQQFLKENLYSTVYGKVSRAEFKEIFELQNKLKSGQGSAEADGLFSNLKVSEQVAKSNGFYASADDNEDKQKVWLDYQTAVNRQIRIFETNSGKKATSDDVKRISDSVIIEKKVNDNWFGSKKPRFQAAPGENVAIEFQDIPADELAAIQQAAKIKGVTLGDDKILQIYLRKINGK